MNEAPTADASVATTPSATPSAAGAQASEAQLLAQAKRLAARDSVSALRQVEALAQKYPNGAFAQERLMQRSGAKRSRLCKRGWTADACHGQSKVGGLEICVPILPWYILPPNP